MNALRGSREVPVRVPKWFAVGNREEIIDSGLRLTCVAMLAICSTLPTGPYEGCDAGRDPTGGEGRQSHVEPDGS
jgi:hypothetical protein